MKRPVGAEWRVDLRSLHTRAGAGVVDTLGEAVLELGGRRALIATDRGIESAGHVERARASLRRAGVESAVFVDVEENPTELCVDRGVAAARDFEANLIVGLGGGSPMDCAKGINFVLTNGGRMRDYWGFGKAERPMLPSIGVPCTAGTGSEAQSFALISRDDDHRKMACGDSKARFAIVLLDPELARTAPREVVAMTGMDALSHSVESYVSRARNPVSMAFADRGWRLLDASFEEVLAGEASIDRWLDMMTGAHLAGAAIECSMLGAAHAMANPLTQHYGITHGAAIAVVLPHVVRFNFGSAPALYEGFGSEGRQNRSHGKDVENDGAQGDEAPLADRLEELRALADLPGSLSDCQVPESAVETLSALACEQWTAQFNPREVARDEFAELYRAAIS